jgi:type I restriction enzyme M protein
MSTLGANRGAGRWHGAAQGQPATSQEANGNGNGNGAKLRFEATLWAAADALRNDMDAAEYRHVVPGLIFLKYISDAFEAKHAGSEALKEESAHPRARTSTRR